MGIRILGIQTGETPRPPAKPARGQPPPADPPRAPEPPPEKPPRPPGELARERERLEAGKVELTAALARERERARDVTLPAAAMLAARRETAALGDTLASIERGLIELQIDELRTRRADIERRVTLAVEIMAQHDPAQYRERRRLIEQWITTSVHEMTDEAIAAAGRDFAEFLRTKRDEDRYTVQATGAGAAAAVGDEIAALRKRLAKMEGSNNGTN